MEKEFVPHEQALALKELGFDQKTFGHCFTNTGEFQFRHMQYDYCFNTDAHKNTFWEELISAPTFSQSFKFFREKYNLIGLLEGGYDNGKNIFTYVIWDDFKDNSVDIYYETYEQAEFELLKKLIEIAKENKL
jgi:hypothetical protein